MLQSIMKRLSSPAGWIAAIVQVAAYRALESRNVGGLNDLITPGSSS